MPGKNYNSSDYRFGFNGKEKADEWNSNGNSYDYGFRVYDPRIAKFLSVDPLSKEYPWNSTYAFAENTPIWGVDLDGLEFQVSNTGQFLYGPVNIKKVNADNIKNNPEEVVKWTMHANPPPKSKSLFKLQFKTEVGAVAGAKVKILGKGVGSKVGVSKPLTNVTYTEQGGETEVGGNTALDASFNAGVISGSAKIDTKGEASLSGSATVVQGSVSTNEEPSTEIQVFEVSAALGIGGTISLTVDPSVISSPNLPKPVNDGTAARDNTTVIMPPAIKPPVNIPFIEKPKDEK